ncbi:MAG TPA: dihydroorotase [bacterium]|nr:dihydroorotase [bacterium]
MKILIKNGRVVDPAERRDGVFDVLCVDGKVAKVGKGLPAEGVDRMVDARGWVVAPGFIDLHTHLREPGYEYKEDLKSGTEAAAAGGFTTVLCMANTQPVNDNAVITEFIVRKAREVGVVRVVPVGAISKGLEGKTLADIGQMADAGIIGVSDDGRCVMDSALMRKALQYARGFNLLVISHAEDENLSGPGSINEGATATELGLPGSPNAAEEIIVARDIALAELTRARLHIAHLSTRGSLDLVRAAKKRGVAVTCEVTPHHLMLTDEAVRGYRTEASVRPPLRSAEDVAALRKGLKEGVVDAVATDHAPHASFEKEVEFVKAAHGLVGLETALPLCLRLVEDKVLRLPDVIRLLSAGPAKIAGFKGRGTLKPGSDADITVFDPGAKGKIDASRFRSKSRNTPFDGWPVRGRVHYTIVGGKVVYDEGHFNS